VRVGVNIHVKQYRVGDYVINVTQEPLLNVIFVAGFRTHNRQ